MFDLTSSIEQSMSGQPSCSSHLQERAPLEPDEWSTVKNKKQAKAWTSSVIKGGESLSHRSSWSCLRICLRDLVSGAAQAEGGGGQERAGEERAGLSCQLCLSSSPQC